MIIEKQKVELATLEKEFLNGLNDIELVEFVNEEYKKHLQCKPSKYENYIFDMDDGNDGNPARKSHHFSIRIVGCGPEKLEYTRKIFYHQIS